MRGTSRVIQAIIAVMVAVMGWMAASQIVEDETMYPANTRYQTWADFADVHVPKNQLMREMAEIGNRNGARIVLLRVGSDPHTIDLVAIAHGEPAGDVIDWYSSSRKGVWLPADTLLETSLTGSYAFSNSAAAQDFSRWLVGHGGKTGIIQRMSFGVSVNYMLRNSGTSYAVAALIVLLIALVWAYSCQQYRSRAVRVMSGVLPRQVILQDFCTQLWHMISAAFVSGCVVGLVVCFIHGWRDTGRFLMVFTHYALIFALISMFAIMVTLLVLRPRVRIIAERSMPFSRMHGGNVVLCSVTAILTMLSLAVGIGAIAQHRAKMRDLRLWQPLGDVVSADLSIFADEDYWQAHQEKLREAFAQLEDEHDLALSESVASFFTPSQGDMPTTEQIRHAIAPYDDVVICNPTFLTMFQIPNDELSRVSISELTPQLQSNVTEYSKLWTVDGGVSMGERLYRWTGDSAFPSLTYGQTAGDVRQSRNPLIILIDEPARALSLDGFLLPALSTGNLVFTNADSLRNTLQQHGVEELISSTSTIANAVYTRAVWLQTTIVGCTTAVVICIIAMLSLLWFSAQTWSVEHSYLIFVRHTAGQRFSGIALRRVMIVAVAWVLILPLVMVILPQLSVVELADNTPMWLSMYVLMAIGLNAILTVLATRRQYFVMVHRE